MKNGKLTEREKIAEDEKLEACERYVQLLRDLYIEIEDENANLEAIEFELARLRERIRSLGNELADLSEDSDFLPDLLMTLSAATLMVLSLRPRVAGPLGTGIDAATAARQEREKQQTMRRVREIDRELRAAREEEQALAQAATGIQRKIDGKAAIRSQSMREFSVLDCPAAYGYRTCTY